MWSIGPDHSGTQIFGAVGCSTGYPVKRNALHKYRGPGGPGGNKARKKTNDWKMV